MTLERGIEVIRKGARTGDLGNSRVTASFWLVKAVAIEGRNFLPAGGTIDQVCKPFEAGIFPLGAHDPIGGCPPIPRGLGLEKFPSVGMRAELLFECRRELGTLPLLVGVDCGTVCIALLKGGASDRVHEALGREFLCALAIDCAPDAGGLAGSEADFVTVCVDTLAQ